MARLNFTTIDYNTQAVNLTTASGAAGDDWAQWAETTNSTTPSNTKSTGGSTISASSSAGTVSRNGHTGVALDGVTWTDGTPTASATNDQNQLNSLGSPANLSITMPVGTTILGATLVLEYWSCAPTISASLSDGSAGPISSSFPQIGTNSRTGVVLGIEFQAAAAGQTMTFTFSVASASSGTPYVGIIGAAYTSALASPRDSQNVIEATYAQSPNTLDSQNVMEIAYPQLSVFTRDSQNVIEVFYVQSELPYAFIDLVALN